MVQTALEKSHALHLERLVQTISLQTIRFQRRATKRKDQWHLLPPPAKSNSAPEHKETPPTTYLDPIMEWLLSSEQQESESLSLLQKKGEDEKNTMSYERIMKGLHQMLTCQIPMLISRIEHAAKALWEQVGRAYFLPLCTVALACLARIRVLLLDTARRGVLEYNQGIHHLYHLNPNNTNKQVSSVVLSMDPFVEVHQDTFETTILHQQRSQLIQYYHRRLHNHRHIKSYSSSTASPHTAHLGTTDSGSKKNDDMESNIEDTIRVDSDDNDASSESHPSLDTTAKAIIVGGAHSSREDADWNDSKDDRMSSLFKNKADDDDIGVDMNESLSAKVNDADVERSSSVDHQSLKLDEGRDVNMEIVTQLAKDSKKKRNAATSATDSDKQKKKKKRKKKKRDVFDDIFGD
jgi:hypothetical protein